MIIVSGTKRAGTSMWMQILKAAGLPVFGKPFPGNWEATLREANPEGFYESSLRFGIYYATNPDPKTGRFFAPDATRYHAVKVFAAGLVKTDLAYVHRVIASMRSFREYVPSLERLYAIERRNRRALARSEGKSEDSVVDYEPISPVLEWWSDNYGLIRDAVIRGYPLHMISYASVLREPERVVPEALAWIGRGDADAALRAVRRELRTHHLVEASEPPPGVSREHTQLFDELFARVDQRQPLDADFIDRLNQADDALSPLIERARHDARRARRSRARTAKTDAAEPR